MSAPTAEETVVDGQAAVELAAGPYTVRFLPGLGMLGSSFTYEGDELVSFHGGVIGYQGGETTGICLLHPWANRLSRLTYEVDGLWVDLDGEPPLHLLDGLPIHGTMSAAEGWRIEAVLADSTRALLQARFVFGEHPRHLRSFPFPHELIVFAELSDLGLRLTTEIRNTGVRGVPVTFGWHPYLTLPGVPRRQLAVVLPDREHLELDGRLLPTGASKHEAAETVVLGEGGLGRAYDDGYRLAGPGAVVGVESVPEPHQVGRPGWGRRIELELADRYDYAQVYAPADAAMVALEPMTAPTDALVSGEHRVVPPGERDSATFVLRVVDPPATPDPDPEEGTA